MINPQCSETINHPLRSGGSKGARGTRPPPLGSKFFQFHAVFGKIWQNCMLAPTPPRGVGPPLLGEILDPPLIMSKNPPNMSQTSDSIITHKIYGC